MKLFLYSGLFPQIGFPKWSRRDVGFKRLLAQVVWHIPKMFYEHGSFLFLNSKVIRTIVSAEGS